MNYTNVVVLDLEMCCWEDRRSGQIIEIGIAEIDLIKQQIVRSSQYYVTNTRDDISDYCTNLTGITQNLLNKQGQPFSRVIQSITDKYGSKNKVYAAWGHDDQILAKQCHEEGLASPVCEYINLSIMYGLHKRNTKQQRIGLETALTAENIPFEGRRHCGLDDAINTAKLALTFL